MIDRLLAVLYPDGVPPDAYDRLPGVLDALRTACSMARCPEDLLETAATKALEEIRGDSTSESTVCFDADPVDQFLLVRTKEVMGEHTSLLSLYNAYTRWAEEQEFPVSAFYSFREALHVRGMNIFPYGDTSFAVKDRVLR